MFIFVTFYFMPDTLNLYNLNNFPDKSKSITLSHLHDEEISFLKTIMHNYLDTFPIFEKNIEQIKKEKFSYNEIEIFVKCITVELDSLEYSYMTLTFSKVQLNILKNILILYKKYYKTDTKEHLKKIIIIDDLLEIIDISEFNQEINTKYYLETTFWQVKIPEFSKEILLKRIKDYEGKIYYSDLDNQKLYQLNPIYSSTTTTDKSPQISDSLVASLTPPYSPFNNSVTTISTADSSFDRTLLNLTNEEINFLKIVIQNSNSNQFSIFIDSDISVIQQEKFSLSEIKQLMCIIEDELSTTDIMDCGLSNIQPKDIFYFRAIFELYIQYTNENKDDNEYIILIKKFLSYEDDKTFIEEIKKNLEQDQYLLITVIEEFKECLFDRLEYITSSFKLYPAQNEYFTLEYLSLKEKRFFEILEINSKEFSIFIQNKITQIQQSIEFSAIQFSRDEINEIANIIKFELGKINFQSLNFNYQDFIYLQLMFVLYIEYFNEDDEAPKILNALIEIEDLSLFNESMQSLFNCNEELKMKIPAIFEAAKEHFIDFRILNGIDDNCDNWSESQEDIANEWTDADKINFLNILKVIKSSQEKLKKIILPNINEDIESEMDLIPHEILDTAEINEENYHAIYDNLPIEMKKYFFLDLYILLFANKQRKSDIRKGIANISFEESYCVVYSNFLDKLINSSYEDYDDELIDLVQYLLILLFNYDHNEFLSLYQIVLLRFNNSRDVENLYEIWQDFFKNILEKTFLDYSFYTLLNKLNNYTCDKLSFENRFQIYYLLCDDINKKYRYIIHNKFLSFISSMNEEYVQFLLSYMQNNRNNPAEYENIFNNINRLSLFIHSNEILQLKPSIEVKDNIKLIFEELIKIIMNYSQLELTVMEKYAKISYILNSLYSILRESHIKFYKISESYKIYFSLMHEELSRLFSYVQQHSKSIFSTLDDSQKMQACQKLNDNIYKLELIRKYVQQNSSKRHRIKSM